MVTDLSSLFGIGQHLVLTTMTVTNNNSNNTTNNNKINTKSHHKQHNSKPKSFLSISLLQMALNVAAQNCHCKIPAFALPGDYNPGVLRRRAMLSVPPLVELPGWLLRQPKSKPKSNNKHDSNTKWSSMAAIKTFSQQHHLVKSNDDDIPYFAPVFHGYCNPGPALDATGASFVVEHIPTYVPYHLRTVEQLALLFHHTMVRHEPAISSMSSPNDVRLVHASFKYEWDKAKTVVRQSSITNVSDQVDYYNILEWRYSDNNDNNDDDVTATANYRTRCTEHALWLLQAAWRFGKTSDKAREPMWGPLLDPLSSIHLNVAWNQAALSSSSNNIKNKPHKHHTVLDPAHADKPTSFTTKVYWDRSVPCHTLSASTRCILAALVRADTLHKDFLPAQLSNEKVLSELRKDTDAEKRARDSAASLGKVTRGLVDAMDFTDNIVLPDREELAERVEGLMDGRTYPVLDGPKHTSNNNNNNNNNTDFPWQDDLMSASPPGRLLSVLALHLGQMQTPARMAALWLAFVEQLRVQWEMREMLPNLNKIKGFDSDVTDHNNATTHRLRMIDDEYTIGKKANLAAFNNCSEPDPDHNFCLISQKLQVFNIGVECAIASERVYEEQQLQRMKQEEDREGKRKDFPDDEDTAGAPPSACYASTTSVTTMQGEGSPDGDDEFFDAANTPSKLLIREDSEPVHVTQRQERRGARCPVHHTTLVASGDQLFAPYLQRPLPVTEDVKIQRKMMMMNQESSIQSRIIIAQRLQKPKLLSDMKAFKAANPGSVFQDFINWYGNPGSPFEGLGYDENLEDISDDDMTCFTARTSRTMRTSATARTSQTAASFATAKTSRTATSFCTARTAITPGDMAGTSAEDAIRILTSTRTFWSDTWDEAEAVPATEQQPPLFDPAMEVEMVLNLFDTIHPSHMLNQILAVNFTTANFILHATAGSALNVKTVRFALDRLQEKTTDALESLEEDLQASMFDNADFISQDTLANCEAVCDAIGDVEVLLARATSLLHKFPGEYEIVQKLLRKRDGEEVAIQSTEGRIGILKTVWKHQEYYRKKGDEKVWDTPETSSTKPGGIPFYPPPNVQEYILRNTATATTNNHLPFQLSAIMQTKGRDDISKVMDKEAESRLEGSILLALNKCQQE